MCRDRLYLTPFTNVRDDYSKSILHDGSGKTNGEVEMWLCHLTCATISNPNIDKAPPEIHGRQYPMKHGAAEYLLVGTEVTMQISA